MGACHKCGGLMKKPKGSKWYVCKHCGPNITEEDYVDINICHGNLPPRGDAYDDEQAAPATIRDV